MGQRLNRKQDNPLKARRRREGILPMRSFNIFVRIFLFCLFTSFSAAYAEEPDQVGQALDQAASDPTASLMNVQIQNVHTGDYHNLIGESGNAILLRSAVPFKTGSLNHIARATLPIATKRPSVERGLSDMVLFDLIVFNQSWGRWGLGPVMLFPTATDDALGAEKCAIGPAVGFVASSRKLPRGVFNQNLFSFAGDDDPEDMPTH